MSFLKCVFFLLALVAVLRAQEMELMDDMDLEEIEELPPTESSNAEPITNEESKDQMEDLVESDVTANNESESMTDISNTMERTPDSVSESTEVKVENSDSVPEVSQAKEESSDSNPEPSDPTEQPIAIIFEEMEERLTVTESLGSTLPSVVEASTDSSDIASEYNGLDANKSVSTFSCYGRAFGQYADVQRDCRVFHLCYPYFNSTNDELLYQRISFLCDNDSVFDQKRFICVDNATVEHKCNESEGLYLQTNQEYLIRVFSQSVSPIDEMKGQQTRGSARNWMSWLYGQ